MVNLHILVGEFAAAVGAVSLILVIDELADTFRDWCVFHKVLSGSCLMGLIRIICPSLCLDWVSNMGSWNCTVNISAFGCMSE